MNGKMSTSNNTSISTLTSTYVNSTNDKVCSLQSPIHENIKYSKLSKIQARAVRHASDAMKTHVKLLSHKTWNYSILEYVLKDKSMK